MKLNILTKDRSVTYKDEQYNMLWLLWRPEVKVYSLTLLTDNEFYVGSFISRQFRALCIVTNGLFIIKETIQLDSSIKKEWEGWRIDEVLKEVKLYTMRG